MTAGSSSNRFFRGARAVSLGTIVLSLLLSSRANAGDPEQVHQLLSKTHNLIEQFVDQFSILRYEEDVAQQKLKSKESDKVAYQ